MAALISSLPDAGIWLCDLQAGTAKPLCNKTAFTLGGILSSSGALAVTPYDQSVADVPPKPGKEAHNAPRAGVGPRAEDEYALWDAQTGAKLATLKPKETGEPCLPGVSRRLAFSPDESFVASAWQRHRHVVGHRGRPASPCISQGQGKTVSR